jgi:succinyl-diaminopimelate desuccinylase
MIITSAAIFQPTNWPVRRAWPRLNQSTRQQFHFYQSFKKYRKPEMSKTILLAALDAERDAHIAFLQEFIRAPSPNPPAETRVAANVVKRYLDTRGIESSIVDPYPETPNIVSEFVGKNAGHRLIMNGHIDVFPVGDAQGWDKDPWSGKLEDGRVHGRGATDMKAGTAASIIAYSYLYKLRHHLNGSVGLTAVSDEETGGKWGSRWLLENDERWQGDCMINAEPSGLGTIRFGEKGTLRLTFTVTTAGAHGAYVHRSESASRIAAALIMRLAEVETIQPNLPQAVSMHLERPEVRKAIDNAVGTGAADIISRPTLNIGTVHAGLKVNMIPASCVFEADIRLPIGLNATPILELVNKILRDFPQTEFVIQEAASNPPSFSPHDHPMVDIMGQNCLSVIGLKPMAVPSLGATDCKFWRYRKVPAYIYGPAPGRMAMTNESVPVEEFIATIKAHALSAWDYLGGEA